MRGNSQKGYALLVVLLTITVIGLLSLPLLSSVVNSSVQVHKVIENKERELIQVHIEHEGGHDLIQLIRKILVKKMKLEKGVQILIRKITKLEFQARILVY
ncbi:hypothetical protein [Evansella halocellulosilytica]|uniref:hypothetical protein n=1 Tax=Evansella halocellulosilytica TaxID=2011013 RepID=UPI000BB67DE4|nr:hypothetical protein [Evansella halocellulosilytica]